MTIMALGMPATGTHTSERILEAESTKNDVALGYFMG